MVKQTIEYVVSTPPRLRRLQERTGVWRPLLLTGGSAKNSVKFAFLLDNRFSGVILLIGWNRSRWSQSIERPTEELCKFSGRLGWGFVKWYSRIRNPFCVHCWKPRIRVQ